MRQLPAYTSLYTTPTKTILNENPLFLHLTLPYTPLMINLSMNLAEPGGLASSTLLHSENG